MAQCEDHFVEQDERGASSVALDDAGARAAGVLCARNHVNDVVDASVVMCAKLADDTVVTTDPDDLRRLTPQLRIVNI